MTPNYSSLFKKWQTDSSNAPKDGTWFMGRISGTNRAKAVHFDGETSTWMTQNEGSVEICQWISFTDFADIRSCVWSRRL